MGAAGENTSAASYYRQLPKVRAILGDLVSPLPIMYMTLTMLQKYRCLLGSPQTPRANIHPIFIPDSAALIWNALLECKGYPHRSATCVVIRLTLWVRRLVKSRFISLTRPRSVRLIQRRQPVPPITFRRLYLKVCILTITSHAPPTTLWGHTCRTDV